MNTNLKLSSRDHAMLMKTPFMSNLSSASAARVMAAMTVSSLPARHLIFRDGETASSFFCVLGGYVRLYRLNREGREADLRICGPGDTFAECLLFGDRRYRYHAQTAESATVAAFDLKAVRALAEQERDVAAALLTMLSQHLLTTLDCVANDRLHTAPQRVANYILAHCPVDGGPAAVRLPFQKSLLAGQLGLAPEALSRAFSKLREIGVTVRGRIIQVGDVQALRDVLRT
ncbi:Crp/Fnr family transcriptional regulator [Rhizobium sp. NTR19]|uniref:Crp/Fnr family transcriptional regulator n=1 Tax=Neorhizobium turbinariae TaxID=2937795 RepID=A0ABT0IWB6_9HYPH|nr:Crp/Fnr family transcriptional regulator [Neorhizobium turbinariae]MCK8782177.1 Crp/Fnr family transcriptional regulator [Neorhizobium turbinariae]